MTVNENEVHDYMYDKYMFTDEHAKQLPTVRIKRVVLDHFKSVDHGEIVLNCGRQYIPYGTKSDILGLYGQNGSGKTALIEALSIVNKLMSGYKIPYTYADSISEKEGCSKLLFCFDMQYPNGEIRELEYSFKLRKEPLQEDESKELMKNSNIKEETVASLNKAIVYDELIRLSWKEADVQKKLQTIIDTSVEKKAFGPVSKLTSLTGGKQDLNVELEVNKRIALADSKSFIFSKKTLKLFVETGLYSVFLQVLLELRHFATYYFFVVDAKSSGYIRLNVALPLYTEAGVEKFDIRVPKTITINDYEYYRRKISGVSDVLSQLVPGLTIDLKKVSETFTSAGEQGVTAMLVAYRDSLELPLRSESDGVRKIISILSLIIAAYNGQSVTLAVDELDAGIFEYLLGELLQSFESTGKGQLIFTSHNLRPLEVLDKKFLVFTTTNPDNRYYRLKNISSTSNLRDTYFRELILGEQDEELYNRTKRFKIEMAMKKAGAEE
ncbi:MAG: AAA family ATPase [Erysipelotrichaceae bacterium]|nr:AAA family ATPase [Erysipelotrichaceae bacterium]